MHFSLSTFPVFRVLHSIASVLCGPASTLRRAFDTSDLSTLDSFFFGIPSALSLSRKVIPRWRNYLVLLFSSLPLLNAFYFEFFSPCSVPCVPVAVIAGCSPDSRHRLSCLISWLVFPFTLVDSRLPVSLSRCCFFCRNQLPNEQKKRDKIPCRKHRCDALTFFFQFSCETLDCSFQR